MTTQSATIPNNWKNQMNLISLYSKKLRKQTCRSKSWKNSYPETTLNLSTTQSFRIE